MTQEAHESNAASHRQQERGIFDCDDAYRTPTKADFERIFETGVVALDTNVLINLYRSNERTRRDTFAVLNKLKSQIWVPHQVISEFWRNRDLPSVRGHHRAKARNVCTALDKTLRSISDATDRWLKDVHLSSDENANRHIKEANESITKAIEEIKTFIEQQAEKDAIEGTSSTHTDPVLNELDQLLKGNVGAPLPAEDHGRALKEAKRRADAKIPPGYADFASKSDTQAAGDYIIWEQVLIEAEQRQRDILLVTGDVKEDWWVPRNEQNPARPRTELRVELKRRAGVELFMLTPSQLLTEADRIFGLRVDERSVSDLASSEHAAAMLRLSVLVRSVIVQSIILAHERAIAAASNVNPIAKSLSPYGMTMEHAVRQVLNGKVSKLGGTTLTVRAVDYPVFDGKILFPLRYSNSRASVDHALNYLNNQKIVISLLNFLAGGPQESMPSHDLPQPALDSRDIFDYSTLEKFIVIPYTSSEEGGVHEIYAATLKARLNGEFEWAEISAL
ncbi:PIN-like domain-containing protein [Streptomyces sp. NPDC003737]|uniref:PIN-like domain-containing protein n=1 Tax=Streptomyces sp. NPDC003737 TaxID=3364685 RepID=UPI0036D15982